MMLIDTHCHLNDPAFESSLPDVIARAKAANVLQFIVPAYDVDSLDRTARLASSYPGIIFPAFGIHPWYVNGQIHDETILPFLRNKSTVAIGEIGLDFSPECPPHLLQMESLKRQLDFARDLDLPVSIHCRKAYEPLYQILLDHHGKIRGVIHSFSGKKDLMSRFLDLGFYISFSGSVTRKTATKYHRNAAAVPLDRVLLETDAPSIATETTAASEVEPCHLVEVARKMAEIRGISLEEICEKTTENARRLFALR